MAEHSIQAGQIYDLRSPGDIERESPPHLVSVVEVVSKSADDPQAVTCRSIPSGVVRGWPIRHFVQAKLVSAQVPAHDVVWIAPSMCMPPHRVARPDQVIDLANQFAASGWDPAQPALIGYVELDGQVQLLSGSHRWAAAVMADLKLIPVLVRSFKHVRSAWGNLWLWEPLMTAPAAGERGSHRIEIPRISSVDRVEDLARSAAERSGHEGAKS